MPLLKSVTVGTGKPVVLLHAFPLSHLVWKNLQAPNGYRLVLPDFPGFGDSPLAPSGLSMAEAAQELENHLLERGINESFVLGGISMGGYWAMEYLRQFPKRVQKVLFVSTRPGVDKPEGRQNRLNMAEKVLKDGTEFLTQAMVPGLLGKATLSDKPEVADQIRGWIRETKPEAVALAQRAMADRRDQTDLMPELKAPALIVAGAEDALIPVSESQLMAKTVPGSRLMILERVGHLVPLEDPPSFQKILNGFLA